MLSLTSSFLKNEYFSLWLFIWCALVQYFPPHVSFVLVFIELLDLWAYSFHPIWKIFAHCFLKYFFCAPFPHPASATKNTSVLGCFKLSHFSLSTINFQPAHFFSIFWIVSITMSSSSLIFSDAMSNLSLIPSNTFHFRQSSFKF